MVGARVVFWVSCFACRAASLVLHVSFRVSRLVFVFRVSRFVSRVPYFALGVCWGLGF